MILSLTHKQLLELKFWIEEKARDGYAAERVKLPLYVKAFGPPIAGSGIVSFSALVDRSGSKVLPSRITATSRILEIGTGPYWGLLPYLRANAWEAYGINPDLLVACDPLLPAYDACGLLEERNGILRVDEPFEAWETNDTFDLIVSTNALDHGEMGPYLLPKMWRMLTPGGTLCLHVHLRPEEQLNLVHDHRITEADFDKHLRYTGLREVWRKILPNDIDGQFCETLIGVWRKPN